MDALRVAVRIRPEETARDNCVVTDNDRISVIKAEKGNKDHLVQSTCPMDNATTYEFDKIFDEQSSQLEVL